MTGPLRVVVATRNQGKAREFGRLLGPAMLVEPLPCSILMPPETEDCFAGNARLKAESVVRALSGTHVVLADDSGLEVAKLGGRPGVHSARFAGEGATDAENVSKLLGLLGEAENRSARFVCALCLILPQAARRSVGARMVEVEGAVEGSIAPAPRGHDGFGYDPIFIPTGWSNTLAEAEPKDKDGVSHRGAACRALTDRLFELGVLAGGAS